MCRDTSPIANLSAYSQLSRTTSAFRAEPLSMSVLSTPSSSNCSSAVVERR